MRFIDEVVIVAASGDGGDGCMSFRREKYVPRGGPDGGDGGKGGALVFEATRRRNTLQDYRRNKKYAAENGRPGEGNQRAGRSGEDLVLFVPVGTVFHDEETGVVLADLTEDGERWELPGGFGGLGNIHFKSSTMRTPLTYTEGKPGVTHHLRLELKLIADVGLLGFPNAGKSTLISRISAAHPKIASHPFTTLVPNLGVVDLGDGQSFVVADIPGLIEGAADGKGLGHEFLRHVERCRVYLHLVSPEDWDDDPLDRYEQLNLELTRYDEKLAHRTQIAVLTKTDIIDEETRDSLLAKLTAASGREALAISSVTGQGIAQLVGKTWEILKE